MNRLFTRKEFTGAHMAALVIAFFGVVIAVNLVMALFATRTWSGLIVENSYVASQHFNETVAAARAQQALGWRGDLSISAGRVAFRLTSAGGDPLPARDAALTFRRPSNESQDHTVVLARDGRGSFAAAHELADGLWVVEARVQLEGAEAWTDSFRIRVKDGAVMR
jgi:nitrogen fixation protein FixH